MPIRNFGAKISFRGRICIETGSEAHSMKLDGVGTRGNEQARMLRSTRVMWSSWQLLDQIATNLPSVAL